MKWFWVSGGGRAWGGRAPGDRGGILSSNLVLHYSQGNGSDEQQAGQDRTHRNPGRGRSVIAIAFRAGAVGLADGCRTFGRPFGRGRSGRVRFGGGRRRSER